MKYLVLMIVLLGLGGCGENSLVGREDATMVVSIVYDKVPCKQLTNERNELARSVGVPVDVKVKFTATSTGLGVFIPDFRSAERRKRDTAVGKIVAMNDSLQRRCGVEKPK